MPDPLCVSGGRTLVKICGLRRVQDLIAARDAGADLIGLIFAPSRRRMEVEEARQVLAAVPDHPPAVGVFVNAAVPQITAVARALSLRYVQLSGQESAAEAALLEVPYFKVLHVGPGQVEEGLRIMDAHRAAAAFLLDSPSPQGGGSGTPADWHLVSLLAAQASRPVLLAGGLTPASVTTALAVTGVCGVDVSSGVERDGWKDPALIEAFVRAARGAAYTDGERTAR